MRASFAAAFALALILLLPGLGTPSGEATGGSFTVRLRIDSLHISVAMPTRWDLPFTQDWILDGEVRAPNLGDACVGEGRSAHSRFYRPAALDVTVRFDDPACRDAEYVLRVIAMNHDNDDLFDLSGDAAGAVCATFPVDAALGAPCAGEARFRLADLPLPVDLDGGNDTHLGEVDGHLRGVVQLLSSGPASEGSAVPPGPGWVVRIPIRFFHIWFQTPAEADDWVLDADMKSADNRADCHATARSGHSQFQPPSYLELVVGPGAASCEGAAMTLHIAAYLHSRETAIDLNGDPLGGPCQGVLTAAIGEPYGCEATVTFPLAAGTSLTGLVVDGREDGGLGCEVPTCVLETDARLVYDLLVLRAPESATAALRFNLTLDATNPFAYPEMNDWLVDANVTSPGCVAQTRTSHSRFVEPHHLDLTFRGPDAQRCMSQPMDVELVAYAHLNDQPFDLDGRTAAEGGGPCPLLPGANVVSALKRVSPDRGCRLHIAWDPRLGPAQGASNGDDDGYPETTGAAITWSIAAR